MSLNPIGAPVLWECDGVINPRTLNIAGNKMCEEQICQP